MYLLDSDTFSRAMAGDEPVTTHILSQPAESLYISSITVEETLRGRLDYITRGRKRGSEARGHLLLLESLDDFRKFNVLAYDQAAESAFQAFPAAAKRAGSNDCRIAALAITRGLVVVAANLRDFEKLPGVRCEDWTQV